MLWKFIVNVLSMLKSGFTGLRCLHFGEEAAVGLPIDDIDRSLEEFTDLDLSFMSDRHSKELDIDIVDSSSPKCKQRNPVNPDLSMIRTLTINFQSIKNKVLDLHALIDSAQPHVIIGTKHGSRRTCLHLNFLRMSMKCTDEIDLTTHMEGY
jgi:hypothetical protein